MYNADGNGDLERGRGPRGLCSAQLNSAPREFYSSAVVVVVGFCDFVKMVAYILHSRSVFLFHQLPPLCAIVHNAIAGCHISKPFARSAAPAQLTRSNPPPLLKFNELLVVYYFLSHNVLGSEAGQARPTDQRNS